jgi:acetolactate synthase-1/2/3 large subunit
MNGAESLLRTAAAAGIEVCFANPGTTEMPFVAAFDKGTGIRSILGLFEGVCTGAADGYGRMAGKPALTLLHLGPGFANGIANLHNARRARTPIINIIGDHATWHLSADAPLTSDIVSLAKPVSSWIRTNYSAETLASDMAEAIASAMKLPGGVATLIVPHDNQLNESSGPVLPEPFSSSDPVNEEAISRSLAALRRSDAVALFLGGKALTSRGLIAVAKIASAKRCRLICETFPARMERGAGMPQIERLPYFPEQARGLLEQFQTIVLAGAKAPVAFFGYPGGMSQLTSPDQNVVTLAAPDDDVVAYLETLAGELGSGNTSENKVSATKYSKPSGALSLESFAAAIASVQPEGAIVMDEGNTSSMAYFATAAGAPRFSYLTLTGGSIGQGLPCATGAAVACPERPVIAIQADGSAMYTLQALWTQAREGLNVTTLLCANNSYRILGVELARSGVSQAGDQARQLVSLSTPTINWVALAGSMGVPASRVETADALVQELERSFAEQGPHLIEVAL